MEICKFDEKRNRVKGRTYVVEEEAVLTDGTYEAPLRHDNIVEATLCVYTGKKLTGQKIESYALSTPTLAPWKRIIRIYADAPVVYISYETEGDTVEAEDVNRMQEELTKTQEALNAEEARAGSAEMEIAQRLSEEIARAEEEEESVKNMLLAETERAKSAEEELLRKVSDETERASSSEAAIKQSVEQNRPLWEDKYTRNEIDNKFSQFENAIDWKEAVNTYAELAAVYPKPEDGWTVNVKDTDYTYRWSGSDWVAISANAVPKATQNVDGLLSKEDKALYDDANSKKHVHGNGAALDEITQATINTWKLAAEKMHEHANLTVLGGISRASVEKWDTVSDKVGKEAGKGLSANDFTTPLLNKLNGIEAGAQKNIQSDWKVTDTASSAYIKNKPSAFPAAGGNAATVNGHSVNADVPAGAKFTDTTYAAFTGATAASAGKMGLVPQPQAGAQLKFLRADGTWQQPPDGNFVPRGAVWNDLLGV